MPNSIHPANNGDSRLEPLRHIDTCTLSNAVERFEVRLRNEGFMNSSLSCRFPSLPPVAGYAVTGRVRSYMAPMTRKCYYENIEWWQYVVSIPAPRILVLQDIDDRPGFGALFGGIHAHICRALNCIAYITNGAVRDLDEVEPTGVQLFSGGVAVSHAYAHVVDFGVPVEVGGLTVAPGDILHGDRNGVICVPEKIVTDLPAMVEQIQADERDLFALTDSREFTVDALGQKLKEFAERHQCR